MSSAASQSGSLFDKADAALEDLVDRFERAWNEQGRPNIDDYLPGDTRQIREVLAELVHVDLERRFRQGEQPRVTDYLQRYPQLAEDASALQELVVSELAWLKRAAGSNEQATPQSGKPRAQSDSSNSPSQLGDYEIVDELGRGGMGVVYRARQVSLQRTVALKVMLAGEFASTEQVERFQMEATAAANLDHSGIVPVYEVGEQDGRHFFSMAYVEGQSLSERLRSGPLPSREAARILREVANAVHYAHTAGVIHRDLKPHNILLDAEGNPKVTDFGLAKLTSAGSDLTTTGQLLGTPSYMSPEQAEGQIGQIGPATDVYALGAVLYFVLTGRPPLQAATPIETIEQVRTVEPVPPRLLNPTVPQELETICLKCLEKEPDRRYASVGDLAEDLARFLAGEAIRAQPPRLTYMMRVWVRKNLQTTIATVLLGVACGGLIAIALVFGFSPYLMRKLAVAYDAFPSLDPPWILKLEPLPEPLLTAVCVPGIIAFFCMGMFSRLRITADNERVDIWAGFGTGLAAGATVFVGCCGLVAAFPDYADMVLIGKAGQDVAVLPERYPDLAMQQEDERVSLVAAKVIADLVGRMPMLLWGMLGATLAIFSFGGVVQSVMAGRLLRWSGSAEHAAWRYVETILLAFVTICLLFPQLGWGERILPPYYPGPLTGNAGLVLLAVAVAAYHQAWAPLPKLCLLAAILLNLAFGCELVAADWYIEFSLYGIVLALVVGSRLKGTP